MAARRVVLALVAVLALSGCGGSDDAPDAAAAQTPLAAASATPTAAPAKAAKAGKPAKGTAGEATVAPEVVAPPSTSDAVSAQTLGGWEGLVVAELKKVEPRLVTSDAAALKKVKATCVQMETGLFETKVVPIIVKRFSSANFTPSYALGQQVYSILLQYACYRMSET